MNTPQVLPPPMVHAGALAQNKTLRNAYLLLSLMMGGAAMAAFATMSMGGLPINKWVFLILALAFPFAINAARNSVWGLVLAFAYCGLLGAFLGPVIKAYASMNPMIPIHAFVTTAAIFVGLTMYALTTKRDFSFLGGFLMAGSIVVLLSIVAIWIFQLSMLGVVLSGLIVLLSSAFILYDTQNLVRDGEANYIVVATSLFASIWSLFANLMHLFGFMSDD
jgi:modulator of FtsH protease